MELRRQVILQKLSLMGIYEARDGRLLSQLSLSDLELEYSRTLDREGRTA
jgi:hypothetical protein